MFLNANLVITISWQTTHLRFYDGIIKKIVLETNFHDFDDVQENDQRKAYIEHKFVVSNK